MIKCLSCHCAFWVADGHMYCPHCTQRALVEASLRRSDTRAEAHGVYAHRHIREGIEDLRGWSA